MIPIQSQRPFQKVVIDVLSLPTSEADQEASTIVHVFLDKLVLQHGVPEEVLSDRGSNFHHQTCGIVERFNRTLSKMLGKCGPSCAWPRSTPTTRQHHRSRIESTIRGCQILSSTSSEDNRLSFPRFSG